MNTNWEYKIVEFQASKAFLPVNMALDLPAVEATLNLHGAEGWELVSTLLANPHSLKFAALLKRMVDVTN